MRAVLLACTLATAFAGGPEILQQRCVSCHNASARVAGLSLETRAEAARVLTGKLLARVQAGEMPPGGGLPAAERAEASR